MQSYVKWKMSCYTPEQLKAAAERGRELTARIERDELRFPRPRSESQGDDDDLSLTHAESEAEAGQGTNVPKPPRPNLR
jgi:hypothetical protein